MSHPRYRLPGRGGPRAHRTGPAMALAAMLGPFAAASLADQITYTYDTKGRLWRLTGHRLLASQ